MTFEQAVEEIFRLSTSPTESPKQTLDAIHRVVRDAICAHHDGNEPTGEFEPVEANGVHLAEVFD